MSMKDMQKYVNDWIQEQDITYWPPLSILAAMIEELGELARELNDRYGGRVKKPTDETKEISDELSDLVFNTICLANSLKLDLEEAFERKMDKCYGRDKDRYKNT